MPRKVLPRIRSVAPDEQPMTDELRHVLVTSWGHWRGEALAVVEAA